MKNKNAKNKNTKNKNKNKNKSNKRNRIMYGGMAQMAKMIPGSMPPPMAPGSIPPLTPTPPMPASMMKGGMRNMMPMMKEGMGCMMKGGMSPVGDMSMAMGQKDNLAQGNQFLEIHKNQHGGMSPYPLGVTGRVLTDSSMVAAARTGPLDSALNQIQGMQDGGARRNKKNKTRGRKHKRGHSRRNRMRGGAHHFTGSPLSENSMLLPSGLEKSAGLNYDWDAARNPNYWAPKP
jgi:hypothetical protein